MTVWVKCDSEQAYLGISGAVYEEHVSFLQDKLLDRLQYGYKRIVVDMNEVHSFDSSGVGMLRYVHNRVLRIGGELVIVDKRGLVGEVG